MSTVNPQLQFLSGGGENGRLIREYDWSSTSLGAPEHWPKSLKTCVRIILTSRQPMFVWWGEELINIYNDAYQAIVGGKHPWALGQPAREVWKEIWDEAVWPRAKYALETNEGTYDESLLLIMERNGYPEETYYTFSYSPVPGDNGEPAGIICANTDDTSRIINERQLRTLKDLGKAYINSKSDDDIYHITARILGENREDFPFVLLYRNLAERHAELAGSSQFISETLTPAVVNLDDDVTPWFLSDALLEKETRIVNARDLSLPSGAWPVPPKLALVLPVVKSGQEQAYGALVVGLNPYRQLDDQYHSFFGLVADQVATGIANVRSYLEERKRVAALMEIDKAKTVFFNNVSHEFRTPLTLMLGPIEEMLTFTDGIPQQFYENTHSIYRNARRLLKLVNSLLEFSRIEAGRVQASYSLVDICGLTADLASGFRSIIEKAGLDFLVWCSPVTTPVYVDREMWEKIVLNLLSNAFKYTLKGSVTLSLEQQGPNVVLRVADTGVGIPKHELPHMFERFHRVPGSAGRTHEGTGIGLSLIHELVKMHQGEITVSSEEGRGSTFTVVIPAGSAHLPPSQVSESGVQAGQSSLGIFVNEAESLLAGPESAGGEIASDHVPDATADKNTRILVADDNADMRNYLRRLLEPHFSVSTAANGKEAFDLIPEVNPHLVISDIMMPVMDGQALVQAIRGSKVSRLPVILLSARAGEEARIEGLEAGADDYLVKPFSAKELLTKVRSHINLGRARNHAEEVLKQVFVNAPVAIGIFRGPQYRVELANPLMLEIWGREAADVLDMPLMAAMPALQGQGLDLLLHQVYTSGVRYVSEEHVVHLPRKGRETEIYVKFMYEPLREVDGSISGIIALAHEITDLVNARSSAQESAEEMRQLVRQKDEFMSIASHELKTPVTSMKALLQILERMNLPDEKAAGFITKAARQVNRLSVLVSDLLDVASLQAGKVKFYPEEFVLYDLVHDVAEQHEQSSGTHHVTVCGDSAIRVTGDRNRLEQVLNNLLSNAIKYSPQSERVDVKIERERDVVRVSVVDFGIGIPESQQSHVFQRFFRVEESVQNFSGLGLGLYISAEIVKRHGGEIGVDTNAGSGSVFWFTLPVG